MKPDNIASQRVDAFEKRFGTAHLYFACHAAFPLALTPDLLYQLWATFQRDIHGELLNIPWVAVADLLLSRLCDEVGYELYEMSTAVRNELISRLQSNDKFGQPRLYNLSYFLLYYVQQQLHSNDPDIRDFAKAQRWTALAYRQPDEAANQLASALDERWKQKDSVELVRIASIVKALAMPLRPHAPQLISYAYELERQVFGDTEEVEAQFESLVEQTSPRQVEIAGVVLPLPWTQTFPDTNLAWHSMTWEEAVELLQSDANAGLTSQQAKERLQKYGPNELEEATSRSAWVILLDQFKNIMVLMLIAAAIVSGILDLVALQQGHAKVPFTFTIAIILLVILNGIRGYLTESRVEKMLAALKRLCSPKVRVIRDSQSIEVEAKELVPGDIMLLEAGIEVPADARLIEASNLQAREAVLTGAAHAVNKQANTQLAEETPLGDRINLVYQGTEVVYGRATAVVTGTGMETEIGKVADMLQAVESEPTPLQQRMTQLGNVLVTLSLVLVAMVIAVGMLKSYLDTGRFNGAVLQELLQVSLQMVFWSMPVSLPTLITETLALGTQRMVRRNALVRKLLAVETLGYITTICEAKTGTLTQNKMVVQQVSTVSQSFSITGEGYAPIGEFKSGTHPIRPEEYPELQTLLIACVLCNDAILQREVPEKQDGQRKATPISTDEWTILGDPTEGALLSLARKGGLEKESLSRQLQRVAEFPFSSERKRMSVICKGRIQNVAQPAQKLPFLMFTKGSPELILERCTTYQQGNEVGVLTETQRQQILEQNNQMADSGLRVLGLAYQPLDSIPPEASDETTERELIWLGLVGMLDASRTEVQGTVARCRDAGIRSIIMTDDQPLTAQALAHSLGIAQEGDRILSGQDLQRLSQTELEWEVEQVSIYAHVSPEDKLRIVQALQFRGKWVAMVSDDSNDAPALKQADIGIAIGIIGTDLIKEASDMVLLDDNFATIVAAIEESRVVYINIRRLIKFVLGFHIGRVLTIAAIPIIGLADVPLSVLQILWIYSVIDGLLPLALAVEPQETDVMRRPPFSFRESIFARGLGSYMVRIGIIFAIIAIILMVWAYNYTHSPGYPGNPDAWKTMVFTTLCLAQMGNALAVRSNIRLFIQLNPFSNPYLLWAVIMTTLLQLAIVYIPPLQSFFGTHYLTLTELVICLGFSSLLFVWTELEKLFFRWYFSRS